MLYISFQNTLQTVPSLVRCFGDNSYLTPHEHAAKHHLQPVKEVLPDDDDHGPAGGPALAGADGFDTRCGCRTGEQSRSYSAECTAIEKEWIEHASHLFQEECVESTLFRELS